MGYNKLKTFLFVFSVLISTVLSAQSNNITGKIISEEDKNPLSGVSITIKGKPAGTQSNNVGEFAITASAGDILVISYAGFTSQEIRLGNQNNVNIALISEASELAEVIVVGYGTVKKNKLTASVSKLDKKFLETGIRSNPAQALAGTIPGLRLVTGSGRPGSLPSITLRGGTNFDASGSPLIIFDGQIRSSLSDISTDEIESIEVLKDASATAIYGARASNGVILITGL